MSFPTDWGQNTFGTELQKYFSGKSAWDEVVDTARKAWEDARKAVS